MGIVDGLVELSSEYMTGTPLWTGQDLVRPADLGLTPALVAALDEWQNHFENHFHPENGWDSTAAAGWYRDWAPILVIGLQRELPVGTRVEVDLWPLTAD